MLTREEFVTVARAEAVLVGNPCRECSSFDMPERAGTV